MKILIITCMNLVQVYRLKVAELKVADPFDVCIHKMTQSDTYLLTVNTAHSIGAKQRHLQLSTL